jgi:hypothetical protein
LDKCKKYRKTQNSNQISAETSDLPIENLTKMIGALAEQNNSLSKQNKSMISLMKSKFSDVDAEINKIKYTPKTSHQIKTKTIQQKSPKNDNKYPTYWELNKIRFPVRCENADITATADLNAAIPDQAVTFVEKKVLLCTPAKIDQTSTKIRQKTNFGN